MKEYSRPHIEPMVFRDNSGRVINYGNRWTDKDFPACACDGCDERWEDLADDLEWETFAIVNGAFTEEVSRLRPPRFSYSCGIGFVKGMGQTTSYWLGPADGHLGSGEQARAKDLPKPVLKNARDQLKALKRVSPDGNWLPWPKRRVTADRR